MQIFFNQAWVKAQSSLKNIKNSKGSKNCFLVSALLAFNKKKI
jgi:hypothetical protein